MSLLRILSNELNKFIAISGRCTHSQINTNGIGKFGPKIEENLNIPLKFLNGVFINETCNRGPLLIDREKLQQLGYLDEQNFDMFPLVCSNK